MVAEGLSGLMRQTKQRNFFWDIRWEPKSEVGLLQYVDDTIFVGEVNTKNVFTIKVMLRIFKFAFGLKVSFFQE